MKRGNAPASTPAIAALLAANVEHVVLEYRLDEPITGVAAARALELDPAAVFKTLVVKLDAGRFAVAVIPVTESLDLKKLARAAGVKRAEMALPADAERVTGYVIGGMSPLGQRTALPTFIDRAAEPLSRMYVSGGRRGLEIGVAPTDLAAHARAAFAPLTRAQP